MEGFVSNEDLKKKIEAGEISDEDFANNPDLWLTEPIYEDKPFNLDSPK